MEQSYRQAPFITSYERDRITLDLANQRLLAEEKLTWPKSDPNQSDSDTSWWPVPRAAYYRTSSAIRLVPSQTWMRPGKRWHWARRAFC